MANPTKRTDKKEQTLARVTIFLKGISKRKFFEELERTGRTESSLGKEIITKYYL
tara:strand:+ start:813 stop:977 length:165 start_codon:yes stop_codon:yes gene_type:complete